MPLRVSGMYSGLDTDSIIEELVKARSTKVDKVKKEQTKHTWKQEAWSGLNTKIKNFFNTSLSQLRYSSSYKKKTTSVSNTSAVSVITGEKAMNGVQTLSVKRLAKSGYMTGAKLSEKEGAAVTGETLVKDLVLKNSDGTVKEGLPEITGTGSFTVSSGDKVTRIEITENTKISDVIAKIQDAGVDANYDEANGRIFISSAKSGSDNDFSITADNSVGFAAISLLGINESLGTSTDPAVNSNAKTLAEYQTLAGYKGSLDSVIVRDGEDNIDAVATMDAIGTEGELYELIKAEIKNGGLDAEDYETALNRLYDKVSFATEITTANTYDDFYTGDAVKIAGQDALITLNGVEYTSSSNNVEVNGLTFTCLSEAEDVTVTTQEDTDGVYDMIKNFFKEYNALVNEFDKLYDAPIARTYQPLTDEEKEDMSEKEIEKWEQTIKDSLLRRDSTLGTLSQAMKNIMLQGTTVGDTKMYLSDFGINTLNYMIAPDHEKNAYHISGDKDDATVSGEADKLKTAIANDPDKVVNFFVQLSRDLYAKMQDLSKGTENSSAGSFYDDKLYKTTTTSYKDKVKEAEAALADYEDKYYAKFAAMEVALSKLQSSTSSITSMLGGGN